MSETQIAAANAARAQIKQVVTDVWKMRGDLLSSQPEAIANVMLAYRHLSSQPEAIANVMLAYRHLEDASMRLGKVIQALDGGVSVYDKTTTVGVD